jgi:hemolysin activation/secretion protein
VNPAPAQAPAGTPFPGQPEPGRNVPPPGPPPAPPFEFSIPAPQRGAVPRAVDEIEFDVTNIEIRGATKFPPDAFKPLTDPLIGHKAKLSEIVAVADQIEDMYRQHGYVLTRAVVPPQTVSNGVFKIDVVEGYVKAAAVAGGDDATRRRVEAYVDPVTQERPATLGSLERGLLLSNDLPGVAASGLLRPSPTEPGASDLVVDLTQVPWQGVIYSDNRGGATSGVFTIGSQVLVNKLPYLPGQLMLDASGTPDFSQRRLVDGRYSRPVGFSGAVLDLTANLSHGAPAAASGSLVSDSWALGSQLTYPLVVSRARRVSLQGGLNIQAEKVTLGSNSFCIFSDDHWRTADVAGTVQQRDLLPGTNTALTLGVTQGLPVLGAESVAPCTLGEGASTGFTKYTFVATHDQPIKGPFSANLHATGQYSRERLVVGEQTSFGGSGIGRGYDPASLAADIGVGAAGELRYDTQLPRYYIQAAQFYVFLDAAKVRQHDEAAPLVAPGEPTYRSLISTGIGVRVTLPDYLSGGIEFAQELRGVPNNDEGKTGSRILFNAAVRF